MKKWDYLIESDERGRRLQIRATKTGDEKDWGNYEDYLIIHGGLERALNILAGRASIEKLDIVRRLLERVKAGGENKAVIMSAKIITRGEEEDNESPDKVYLLSEVTGGMFRVREQIYTGINGTRWKQVRNLSRRELQSARFHIVNLRPEDMPKD